MQTLIVNTYAGSLLLGANAVKGSNIVGSFDVGYGDKITAANRARFTEATSDFRFVNGPEKSWPNIDLTDAVMLAHPPCSAFSQQNTSASKRGTGSDAFDCTRKVLRYGVCNNVAAMAIESVVGALAGAWDIYDEMAEQSGYHVYRILKNSLCFGVPQYRERFWAVLVRKGLASPDMRWTLSPRFTNIEQTIGHLLPGTPVHHTDRTLNKFIAKLVNKHGFDPAEVRSVGCAHQTGHRRTGFARLITARFFPGQDPKVICRTEISPFSSGQPSILAEGSWAPVLLGSSLWIYRGAPVPEEGYKAIMGFPPDYVFPDGHDRQHIRTFLSKGVCPPVATWVLDNIRGHLGLKMTSEFTRTDSAYIKVIGPGHIASFRPAKTAILKELEGMHRYGSPESTDLIELRDEEEDLEA